MSTLKTLAFTTVSSITANTPEQQRRNKLIAHLQEQLGMARAEIAGETYAVRKRQWKSDDDGNKVLVERDKRLKKWWQVMADNSIVLTVRWGSKLLEFDKGKAGIICADLEAVQAALQALITASNAGELDAHIAKANAARIAPKKRVT
ncbi:DUF6641 family protein [Methylocystis sp. IM3]|uniref:DUF6641 family protein n=1 Tax=unclassified Methylocystis TaxID=2625913 RepID=UPI0030FC97C7